MSNLTTKLPAFQLGPMPIDVVCPQGHTLRLPDRLRGKRAICPACEYVVAIPGRLLLYGYRIAVAAISVPAVGLLALMAMPLFSKVDEGIVNGLIVICALFFGLGVPVGTGLAAVEKGYGAPVAILAAFFGLAGLIYVTTLPNRSLDSAETTS